MQTMPLTPDHLPLLRDLQRRTRLPERVAEYPAPADLEEALADAELLAHARLWLDGDGRAVAYAWAVPWGSITFETDPAAGPALELEALDWACAEARRAAAERGDNEAPAASCRSNDVARLNLLESAGFVRLPDRTRHYARSLERPIPEAPLPPGFRLLRSDQASTVEEWVAMHRAAWGTENMTVAGRQAIMAGSDYDPELDLAVVAPDGRLAGYCVVTVAQAENALTGRCDGYTDPLSVHPDFQRRGLAAALLAAAMHRLRQRGVQTARLTTAGDNLPMQRAAERMGYELASETIWLELH